jgi:hypothetical protein
MILRTLVVLALLLGAVAPPGAAAMDAAPEPASHSGHHGPDHAPAQPAPDGHSGGHPADCCSLPGCDCGCAAPQVLSFMAAAVSAAWERAPAAFAFVDTTPAPSFIAAPFRPPA